MKWMLILSGVIIVALLAVLAYAYATDTDGGRNPLRRGTCTMTRENGVSHSFTDYCASRTMLIEYYPVREMTCRSERINCAQRDGMCIRGSCVHRPSQE
ncbi:MAG: hypothetical protein V1725_02260 [archaeon]